jgi:hypothetical protein
MRRMLPGILIWIFAAGSVFADAPAPRYVRLSQAPAAVHRGVVQLLVNCTETVASAEANARLLELPLGGPAGRDFVFTFAKKFWRRSTRPWGGDCGANSVWMTVWLEDSAGRYHRHWMTYNDIYVRRGQLVLRATDPICPLDRLKIADWADCMRVWRWDARAARLQPLTRDMRQAQAETWLKAHGYREYPW